MIFFFFFFIFPRTNAATNKRFLLNIHKIEEKNNDNDSTHSMTFFYFMKTAEENDIVCEIKLNNNNNNTNRWQERKTRKNFKGWHFQHVKTIQTKKPANFIDWTAMLLLSIAADTAQQIKFTFSHISFYIWLSFSYVFFGEKKSRSYVQQLTSFAVYDTIWYYMDLITWLYRSHVCVSLLRSSNHYIFLSFSCPRSLSLLLNK